MQTLFLLSAILAVQGAAILETPKTNLTKPEPAGAENKNKTEVVPSADDRSGKSINFYNGGLGGGLGGLGGGLGGLGGGLDGLDGLGGLGGGLGGLGGGLGGLGGGLGGLGGGLGGLGGGLGGQNSVSNSNAVAHAGFGGTANAVSNSNAVSSGLGRKRREIDLSSLPITKSDTFSKTSSLVSDVLAGTVQNIKKGVHFGHVSGEPAPVKTL